MAIFFVTEAPYPIIPPSGIETLNNGFSFDDNPWHPEAKDNEFYLYGIMDGHINIDEFSYKVKHLEDGQVLTVYVNSPGGYSAVEEKLLNIMQGHKGTIIAIVDHFAASAAADFLLEVDKVQFRDPTAMVVYHQEYVLDPVSWLATIEKYRLEIDHHYSLLKYAKILTTQELTSIFQDNHENEVWLSAETFHARLVHYLPEKVVQ